MAEGTRHFENAACRPAEGTLSFLHGTCNAANGTWNFANADCNPPRGIADFLHALRATSSRKTASVRETTSSADPMAADWMKDCGT
ncbi:MAG: hypothetical protein ACRCXD_14530, partial [Luteolibacter sp.]